MTHRYPAQHNRCDICDEPRDGRFWVHDFDQRVHEDCRPWHEVPWIFDDLEQLLRRSKTERAQGFVDRLAHLRRAWPKDAVATVNEVRRMIPTIARVLPAKDRERLLRLTR